jgi:DNA polymerase V
VGRCIEPVPGKVLTRTLNGELTVKRLQRANGRRQLQAENPAYPDIAIHEELDMVVWGLDTNGIHPQTPRSLLKALIQ